MECADRGTLFLDEIGEMPPGVQVRLLRALQERQVRHVGGQALIDVDTRVVSATNRDLRNDVVRGRFRDDLFYRVSVITINVPPLRAREGDVPLLARAFLARYGAGYVRDIDRDAMAALVAYAWPGNVRELQNVIERACVLAERDHIGLDDLPDEIAGRPSVAGAAGTEPVTGVGLELKDARRRWLTLLEAAHLRDILVRHDWRISAAANAAGIDRKTLSRLITKYRLK